MQATASFTRVVNTLTSPENKPERRALTLLLGDQAQTLSDDLKANCRAINTQVERAEAQLSLVMAVRLLWATIPEALFSTPDPNYERLAARALLPEAGAQPAKELVQSLSVVYRRLSHARRYGRAYLSSLDLNTPEHSLLLKEQRGCCALCRYKFSEYDLYSASSGEEELDVVRASLPGEVTLQRYRRTPALDHLIPYFLGGDGVENWQVLCASCNGGKGEGLSWILRRGLLPPSRPSEALSISPSLRHAVLSHYASGNLLAGMHSDTTGELRMFRKDVGRLPVFDNLEVRGELLSTVN